MLKARIDALEKDVKKRSKTTAIFFTPTKALIGAFTSPDPAKLTSEKSIFKFVPDKGASHGQQNSHQMDTVGASTH